jgi:hypothetical protein
MDLAFRSTLVDWHGPPPYVFARIPDDESDEIADVAHLATYGWGCIPVSVRIGSTDFTSSLFPHEDCYMLPVKVAVRRAEEIDVGDEVAVDMHLELRA